MRGYGNHADAPPWVRTFECILDIQIAISCKIGGGCQRWAAGANNKEAVTEVHTAKPQCLQCPGGTCSWRTAEPHASMDGTSPLWCIGWEQGNVEPSPEGRFPWEISTERPTDKEVARQDPPEHWYLGEAGKWITESKQLRHGAPKRQKKPHTNWQPSALAHSLTWQRVHTVGHVPRRLEQTVEPLEALAITQAGWHKMWHSGGTFSCL